MLQGGLAALNSSLEQPVPMNRFRPNLVVDDRSFWAEDTWEAMQFYSAHDPEPSAREANLKLRLAAPASRCSVSGSACQDCAEGLMLAARHGSTGASKQLFHTES